MIEILVVTGVLVVIVASAAFCFALYCVNESEGEL